MSVKSFHFFVQAPVITSHLSENRSQTFFYDLLGSYALQPPFHLYSHSHLIFSSSSLSHSTLSPKSHLLLRKYAQHNLALGLGALHLPFFSTWTVLSLRYPEGLKSHLLQTLFK